MSITRQVFTRKPPWKPMRLVGNPCLSGLIYCGACGAKFIVATHDNLRCSARTNRGACDTSRTLLMGEVEQRVLSALRSYLLSPDVVASGVETYQHERKPC